MRNLSSGLQILVAFALGCFVSGCDQLSGASKQEAKPAQAAPQPASQTVADVQDSVAKAQSALSSKNYGQAVEAARVAVNADPRNPKALFVQAEALGANGDVFGSLKSIDDALRNGYDNKNAIYASEYLEKTRASAGFGELMRKYGMAQGKMAKREAKGRSYQSEDTVKAGDVKINMKEFFKDDK